MAQRGLSLLARSIDSIVYWRDPMASAGLLAAGLGFYFLPLDHDFLLSYCGPKASRFVEPLTLRYSSTATAIMLCLVHLLVSSFVQIRNSTKLVGRVGVAAVLVTIVFLLVVFDVYVAAFIDALLVHLHVTGTHTFGDGSYTGEWCGGKRHGQGIMRALGVHLPDLAVCLAVAGLMIAFIYVVFFIVHLSVSKFVQFCWTFKELGRVGVAVVVTAVLVALVLQDMALACSMACSIACMYVAFFIFHLLVSKFVQLWWTYSERVGRFGVAAVLVTIVLRDMALACSACMYFMFFIVHFFVSLLVSEINRKVQHRNGSDNIAWKLRLAATLDWYLRLAATQDLGDLVLVLVVLFAIWNDVATLFSDKNMCLIGFVLSFIVPFVYETFCKQKIAMLNPGRDKIETFCDQKIALLKDKIVAFHDVIVYPLTATRAFASSRPSSSGSSLILIQVPPYWKNKTGFKLVPTKFGQKSLQNFMVAYSCCSDTKKTRVVSVDRVENESLWRTYQLRRDIIKKTCAAHRIQTLSTAGTAQPAISKAELSTDINEFHLFHGTSWKNARVICEHGFDERVASLSGLYGAGTYFAVNSCKSHQYSQKQRDSSNFVVLVCRVVMGSPYCTSTQHNQQRRPPDNPATPGRPFDSIFAQHGKANGGQQRHNEYVVFDRQQVYPEYIVQYTV